MSLLAILFAMAGDAPAPPCAPDATQMELNGCAADEYRSADAELSRAWRRLRIELEQRDSEAGTQGTADGHFAPVEAAQRAWLSYRDAHCSAIAGRYDGGSIQPMIRLGCFARLMRARTAQLSDYLN